MMAFSSLGNSQVGCGRLAGGTTPGNLHRMTSRPERAPEQYSCFYALPSRAFAPSRENFFAKRTQRFNPCPLRPCRPPIPPSFPSIICNCSQGQARAGKSRQGFPAKKISSKISQAYSSSTQSNPIKGNQAQSRAVKRSCKKVSFSKTCQSLCRTSILCKKPLRKIC